MAGLSALEVRSALGTLERYGFAESSPDGYSRAVPPDAAVRALIRRRQAELRLRSAELEQLRATAQEVARSLSAESVPAPEVRLEAVAGARDVEKRVTELLATAENEVTLLHVLPPDLDLPTLRTRQVRVRVLIDRGLLAADGAGLLADDAEPSVDIRVAAERSVRAIVADRAVVLLPPGEGPFLPDTALIVDSGPLHDVLSPLVDTEWRRAVPVRRPGHDDVSPADRRLLTLLAAGLKDEAIARQLGLHVHTVRRRITRMLHALGAATRFEAGLQAAKRGWFA